MTKGTRVSYEYLSTSMYEWNRIVSTAMGAVYSFVYKYTRVPRWEPRAGAGMQVPYGYACASMGTSTYWAIERNACETRREKEVGEKGGEHEQEATFCLMSKTNVQDALRLGICLSLRRRSIDYGILTERNVCHWQWSCDTEYGEMEIEDGGFTEEEKYHMRSCKGLIRPDQR